MDLYDDNDMNYSCESFMDFCDRMMIADEGTGKAIVVSTVEVFRSLINAIHRLLNHVRKLSVIVMPKKIINSYNKFQEESTRFLNLGEDNFSESAYEKVVNSPEYEAIMNFDTSNLNSSDYVRLNSSALVKCMNKDLKMMNENRGTANIKYAYGRTDTNGNSSNAHMFRKAQKIHMMRYKVYVKICGFKLPDRSEKDEIEKANM